MDAARGYRDRKQAGEHLANALARYADEPALLVLALPRGGVPVAFEVARALDAPLDVLLVRKLGVPTQPELALGAIASGGARVLNRQILAAVGIGDIELSEVEERERAELERRERAYRGDRPRPAVEGRTVLLVDDGVATGSTMRAAIEALRAAGAARIVVAVPLAPLAAVRELAAVADEVVCPSTPEPFHAISLWYEEFPQVSDEEVRELLRRAARRDGPGS